MSGEVKLTKALPFPQNWHMVEGAHFNGGKEWFGYRMNCVEQPRLSRMDRYTRKDRSVASTWEVDGVACADADAAWLALQAPPEVTQEERDALALIGDEPADLRDAIPYEMRHWLRAKGLIEYGPPGRCKRTPAGLAALSQNKDADHG